MITHKRYFITELYNTVDTEIFAHHIIPVIFARAKKS